MWQHCIEAIEKDPLSLDRECDWVIKYRLARPIGHATSFRSATPEWP